MAIRTELDGNAAAWSEEKANYEANMKVSDELLKVSKNENALLHSQVATLASAAERLGEPGDGSSVNTEAGDDATAKSMANLREVVSYMRRERDLLDNKLEVLNQELDCERASAAVLKRSLDESR